MDPDDLPGRLHRGTEQRVHAAQLGGREGRGLHRDEGRRREQSPTPAQLGERGAQGIRTASSTIGTPVTFDRNGTVRLARGFTSMR